MKTVLELLDTYPDPLAAQRNYRDLEWLFTLQDEQIEKFLKNSNSIDRFKDLDSLPAPIATPTISINEKGIQIGTAEQISAREQSELEQTLLRFNPWRTGPYSLFGISIKSEWNSERKFERLLPYLPEIKGKRVVDIGCSSGYLLFRLSSSYPELLLGIDPSWRCWIQFLCLQHYANLSHLAFSPIGVEHIGNFDEFFHYAFCMGVIYHRRDPITALQNIFKSLKPEGILFLESITIPLDGPVALSPPNRYAGMRNAWFIPSPECLVSWAQKAGFQNIEVLDTIKTSTEEQRTTRFAPDQSLSDFLDPDNPELTIEGFPAPERTIVRMRK